MLRRLVVAAADEPLAARIVLQRLLPGLLAIVRREQQRDRDVDAFDLLAAEAWMAIVTYRRRSTADGHRRTTAQRRPSPSIHDAAAPAGAQPARRLVPPARLDQPRDAQPGSSFEELTIVLREARHDGLADADLAALCDYLAGTRANELAAQRKVSPRTMRNRRQRAVDRVRHFAA